LIGMPFAFARKPLAPPELEAIRRQAPKIKQFVARNGERSSQIFARALKASFSGPQAFAEFLLAEPEPRERIEACLIVRALGYNAAALLPQLIASYYCRPHLDRMA
jgi:hypothetical protein